MARITLNNYDVVIKAILAVSAIRQCAVKFAFDLILANMDHPLILVYDSEFEAMTMREQILEAIDIFYTGDEHVG